MWEWEWWIVVLGVGVGVAGVSAFFAYRKASSRSMGQQPTGPVYVPPLYRIQTRRVEKLEELKARTFDRPPLAIVQENDGFTVVEVVTEKRHP